MRGPRFDVELTPGGYAWWYLDALSDDGRYGLTAIAFLGSVFSPYYSAARKERGQVNPLEHVAINVVLSGPRNENAWVFTERSATSVQRKLDELVIGRSRMAWDGDGLLLTLDEPTIGTPPLSKVGERLVGRIRLDPFMTYDAPQVLDLDGHHHWWPVAPRCRIEVDLGTPSLSFRGSAYHDTNWGDEPLERGFRYWNWSRAQLAGGTAILYDVEFRAGRRKDVGLMLRGTGDIDPFDAPVSVGLGKTVWGIPRRTRVTRGGRSTVRRSLVSSPFYSRAVLSTSLAGESVEAIHEVVDLDRFTRGWVQWMLRYKILRRP